MRVSGFLSLLFFCDAYEFFTNFRIKELPIKLFPYNFVRPHKSFETRIIVVLYWKGFFLIRDIEVLSYFLGVTMAESKGMRWVMVYITPGRRWKCYKKVCKSCTFYNRSTFFEEYFITHTILTVMYLLLYPLASPNPLKWIFWKHSGSLIISSGG